MIALKFNPDKAPKPDYYEKSIHKVLTITIIESLEYEDSLHIDLRTLTFRFIVPHKLGKKDLNLLNEKENFKGTIQGDLDRNKQKEIDFWKQHYKNGITDDQVIKSANNFIVALDKLEKKLCENKYILNDNLSILDVAWFISINRIIVAYVRLLI